jgi:hypothetical protein
MHRKNICRRFFALILIIAACAGPAGAAYLHNETIWSAPGNQIIEESYWVRLAFNPLHSLNEYHFFIQSFTDVPLITSFTNPTRKDGATPRVRNITFGLDMPVGVNVTSVTITSGRTLLYHKSVTWKGTGAYKEYRLMMDSHKTVNKGLTAVLDIDNTQAGSALVKSYGAGAVMEWN